VGRFTTDNNCSIEFDIFGLSMKDLQTQNVIARCNSTDDLYLFFPPTSTPALATTSVSTTSWHCRLGHLGSEALSELITSQVISCTKPKNDMLANCVSMFVFPLIRHNLEPSINSI
jgi:hypothetical protein